jgi:hypothetical protein
MTEIPGEDRAVRGDGRVQDIENDTARENLEGGLARTVDPDISEFDDEAPDGIPANRDPE